MANRRRNKKSGDGRVIGAVAWILVLLFAFGILIEAVENNPAVFLTFVGLAITLAIIFLYWRHSRRVEARRMNSLKAQNLGSLLTVSGEEFEEIVRDLFLSIGFQDLQRIGGSGDLGVDLTGRDSNGSTVIVQCKRYGRGQKIGSPVIQSLMGSVVNSGADRGIFVTTSSFTAPAINHAKNGRVSIELIDGDVLTQLAVQASSG